MTSEIVYILRMVPKPTKIQLENFSLFSIQFFLNKLGVKVPNYLSYMSQIIGLFEIAFWFLISLVISRISSISFCKAFIAVLFYIIALIIWLLAITIITLML